MIINKGFTLIELAMAMFIISLVVGGFLTPLSMRIEQDREDRADAALAELRETLLGYAVIHTRLPCPGNADGAEDCTLDSGTLPYITLAVDHRYDPWGNAWQYEVYPTLKTTFYVEDLESVTLGEPVAVIRTIDDKVSYTLEQNLLGYHFTRAGTLQKRPSP